ncbi:MAG: ABC transporter ATP-binding protein, partial [Elusimicrobiota bacterium]
AEAKPAAATENPSAQKTLETAASRSAGLAAKPLDPAEDRATAGELFDGAEEAAASQPKESLGPLARAGRLASTLKRMSSGDPSIREFTRPYKRKIIAARVMRMMDAPIAIALGWGTGRLIDLANTGHAIPGTLVPFLATAAILAATTIGELISDLKYILLVNFMQYDLIEAFRVDVFKRIFASSRKVFGKEDTSAVANRLSDDAADVVNLGITTPISTPYHLLGIASSMAMLLWTNIHAALSSQGQSKLALPLWLGVIGILGAVMVAYGLVASRTASKFEKIEEEYQTRRSDMVAHAQRSFGDRAVYLGLGIEDHAISLFQTKARALAELGKHQTKVEQRYHFKQRLLGLLSTDLMITLAASTMLYFAGFPSVGMITAMTAYAVGISQGVAGLADDFTTYRKSQGGTAAIRKLREAVPDADAPGAVDLGPLQGRVEFRNVSFAYDEGGPDVLKNVSFTIEPGESVAFVGPSGAGKSTILNLVTRLYRPTAGTVLVDGKDLAALKINTFRHQLALVPQESGLFNASIKDNLMMVKPSATAEDIEHALKAAGAYDFILDKSKASPKTVDAGLSLGVGEFSGGQQQRIAIARAFLRNSKLMLLDEWSSALDQETERTINRTIDEMRAGRTVVVVDHNLRFDKSTTHIFVLEAGRIVASGKHAELMKTSPLYAKLVSIAQENAADPK